MQTDLFGKPMTAQSDSNEHYTPGWLTRPIAEVLGGFDIDPAAAAHNNVGARVVYVGACGQDGLAVPWTQDGTESGPPSRSGWCNPPYKRPTAADLERGAYSNGTAIPAGSVHGDQGEFVAKAAAEVEAGRVGLVVMLVQQKAIGTQYAFSVIRNRAAVGLLRGRIAHVNEDGIAADGSSTFGSMLVVFAAADRVGDFRRLQRTLVHPVVPSRHEIWWISEPAAWAGM